MVEGLRQAVINALGYLVRGQYPLVRGFGLVLLLCVPSADPLFSQQFERWLEEVLVEPDHVVDLV